MTGCVCRELPSPSFVVVTTQLFVTSNATLKYESLIRKRLVESEGANFLKSYKGKHFFRDFWLAKDSFFLRKNEIFVSPFLVNRFSLYVAGTRHQIWQSCFD